MFDAVTLSRIQFGGTIMFHYLFPPLTIGLGVVLVYLEGRFLWTKDVVYETAAHFWTQLFAATFAMGVATGLVMEFQYQSATLYTLAAIPGSVPDLHYWPAAAALVVLNVLAIANVPRALFLNQPGQAFASSCATIATLVALFGTALWPNLVRAGNDPGYSLDIYRAASSPMTLKRMLVIAAIGVPLFPICTGMIYWVFRHRVSDGESGY